MKKFIASTMVAFSFFAHSVSAADNPSFKVNANDNTKGTLSMRVLDLENDSRLENVNIEFDFRTSTFRVLTERPANAPSSSEPIKSTSANEEVTVNVQSCVNTNRVVTCQLTITNNEFDDDINFCADSGSSFCGQNSRSTATDNFGNVYTASNVSIADESSPTRISGFPLPADTPTNASIEFKNVSSSATGFPLIQLIFGKYRTNTRGIEQIQINLNDITF